MLRSTLIALAVVTAGSFDRSSPQDAAPDARRQAVVSDTTNSSKRMADDHEWTTDNLKVRVDQSYCYDDTEWNCGRYGRLYTWEAAQQGCRLLGDGWRLPTNDEWRHMVLQLCQGAARSLSSTLRREAAGLLRAVHKTVTARQ